MGEKTTIEIEHMRELKQHALDTNKTLKQIINEAIIEKINRERDDLKLPRIEFTTTIGEQQIVRDISEKITTDISGEGDEILDPQILDLIRIECQRHGLNWEDMTREQWDEKLEYSIQTALEMVYDEPTAEDTIRRIKMKLEK